MPSCNCQIITTFKSGNLKKSPPVEKLLKNYEFKTRHCSLGLVDPCQRCSKDGAFSSGTKLVFSYYEDTAEQKLKGRFEVERSKLERVDVVEECASKYRHEKHILKWTLTKYNNRKLYLLCDNEDDLNSWLNLFKDYKQARRQSRQMDSRGEDSERATGSRGSSTSSCCSSYSNASSGSM